MHLAESIGKDLARQLEGQLMTGIYERGRYSTDASIYQMMPLAVVLPRNDTDVSTVVRYASKQSLPLLPRGAGTSQCGQTVNEAIVIDYSQYLNRVLELDIDKSICRVEGGIVLDELNRRLRPYGLWFPVDVSTASRATIGGMAANNSCGSRSIRYGLMRDNVAGIEAMLPSGEVVEFGKIDVNGNELHPLFDSLLKIGRSESEEIRRRFPKVMRRVGGYNIDALISRHNTTNLSHLLVGSEGTLALFRSVKLKLSPVPRHKMLGICHFPDFQSAMESVSRLVELGPTAVELIDRTMIELARMLPLYQNTVKRMLHGEPQAVLLVEFSESTEDKNHRKIQDLHDVVHDLGFDFSSPTAKRGGVIEAIDPQFQSAVFEVRKAGLNIMMSMRDDRKPVSFVEDCAVELQHLPEYTARLTEIFAKYGTRGTWYAHASVGCLHVRPVLDMRDKQDTRAMRAIAEECFEMVREYKGSHSGEHGDGICRSEFHTKMFGQRMVESFEKVKNLFDPNNLMNPGKIVKPFKMDDTRLFRYSADYEVPQFETVLDWRKWTGSGDGFQGAVEMCNNNGACRKLQGGVMCPSYRVTREEKHVTRGRANTLRLAISGQLGPQRLASKEMREAMQYCVSCKACRRECPAGVDMAKMKIEVMAAQHQSNGSDVQQRLIANLPRYAPLMSRFPRFFNFANQSRLVRTVLEPVSGFSRHQSPTLWSSLPFIEADAVGPVHGKPVLLFADTFNIYFEPDNLRAATRLLTAAGYRVHFASIKNQRPICCGRTYLATGMIKEAKREIERMLSVLKPFLQQQIPIVGLEPSCILGMRDETLALVPGDIADKLSTMSFLFEEFWEKENPSLEFGSLPRTALVHGHCHQKSFNQMSSVECFLSRIVDLKHSVIESGCCGMAGAFGYQRETYDTSRKMAQLDLLPAIENAPSDTLIVTDGISCRQQIEHCAGRNAIHAVRLVAAATL